MKYMKRSQIYQASNVTFNPQTKRAYSYSWWRFVDVIEGKTVFNNHGYSNSTRKHQNKVMCLMRDLGIKIDLLIDTNYSLSKSLTLAELEENILETLNEREYLETEKRERRNAKARERAAAKRAQKDAEFKANLDSITYEDIQKHREGVVK